MRAVINGKRYDTKSATLVASWSNGEDTSNFHHCEEELYRTPRGNWFIAGRGGALSPYRESLGVGSWGPGAEIRPLSPEEAMAWLEQRGRVAAIEKYFPDQVEDA